MTAAAAVPPPPTGPTDTLLRDWSYNHKRDDAQTPVAVPMSPSASVESCNVQPVVATLVTNFAWNLLSWRLDQVYAGIAEKVIEDTPPTGVGAGGRESGVKELGAGPASATLGPAPATNYPLCLDLPNFDGRDAEVNHDEGERCIDDWVIDGYDEAELHVVDNGLVVVRVPLPIDGVDSDDEEALMRQRRGCRRRRRPSAGSYPRRRRQQSSSCDNTDEKAPEEMKRPGVSGRFRKWAIRRRETRAEKFQQRRGRKMKRSEDFEASNADMTAGPSVIEARDEDAPRDTKSPLPLQKPTEASSKTKSSRRIEPKIPRKPKSKPSMCKGRKGRTRSKKYLHQLHEDGARGAAESSDPEMDDCLRLKPLPRDPRPRLPAAAPAPVAQSTQRSCSSIAAAAANIAAATVASGAVTSGPPALALAACATAQVVHAVAAGLAASSTAKLFEGRGQLFPANAIPVSPVLSALVARYPPPTAPSKLMFLPANPASTPVAFHSHGPLHALKGESKDDMPATCGNDNKVITESEVEQQLGEWDAALAALSNLEPHTPEPWSSLRDEALQTDDLLEKIMKEIEDDLQFDMDKDDPTTSLVSTDTDASSLTDSVVLPPPQPVQEVSTPYLLDHIKFDESFIEVNGGKRTLPQVGPAGVGRRGRSWTAPPLLGINRSMNLLSTAPRDTASETASADLGKIADNADCSHPEGDSANMDIPLKVVLIGCADTPGRLDLSRLLTNSRRSSDSYEICDPLVLFGANNSALVHPANQSILFPREAVYVLTWDMAVGNPKTWRQHHASNIHIEDDFAAEVSDRIADRAIECDIADMFAPWLDGMLHGEDAGTQTGGRPYIVPVVIPQKGCGNEETRRRCAVLRRWLLRQSEKWVVEERIQPDILFAGEGGNIPVYETGRTRECSDLLRGVILRVAFATERRRRNESESLHLIEIVHRVINTLMRKGHKIVPFDSVVSLVAAAAEDDNRGETQDVSSAVKACLNSLSSIGKIRYFSCVPKNIASTMSSGDYVDVLSKYVVLKPKWLTSVISCIIRPDLKREIIETRCQHTSDRELITAEHSFSFLSSGSNCPIISPTNVSVLWQSMQFMRDTANEVAMLSSEVGNSQSATVFDYLKALFEWFGIFIPIKFTTLQGPSFSEEPLQPNNTLGSGTGVSMRRQGQEQTLYLLPSLIAQKAPTEVWTFKARESWNTALCQSWLFRNKIVPCGLMERIVSTVLQDLLNHANSSGDSPIRVQQVMMWKTAFFLKVGLLSISPHSSELCESTLEIFGTIVGADSSLCIAADSTGISMKRLIISAKGLAGDSGRKIWDGGYNLVLESVNRILNDQYRLRLDIEAVCPECLRTLHPSKASTWNEEFLHSLNEKDHSHARCAHGHQVETGLLCGIQSKKINQSVTYDQVPHSPSTRVNSLLSAVVLVGLWDAKSKQIRNIGSGFIADKEKGLIVTASHILFEMQAKKGFGKMLYGLEDVKVVVGIIPKGGANDGSSMESNAVFRYFAEIVAHDVHKVDACILRITTKLENDVIGDGEGCGDQPEVSLLHNKKAMKAEKLQMLKITKDYEREQSIRILGYNQGGEGRLKPGMYVNRNADFASGYVCTKFKVADEYCASFESMMTSGFSPLEEIVAMCPTIPGHSGGPCVNDDGAVIGILSRSDPAESHRCYLVPGTALKKLLKKAKAKISMSPLDLYYLQAS